MLFENREILLIRLISYKVGIDLRFANKIHLLAYLYLDMLFFKSQDVFYLKRINGIEAFWKGFKGMDDIRLPNKNGKELTLSRLL